MPLTCGFTSLTLPIALNVLFKGGVLEAKKFQNNDLNDVSYFLLMKNQSNLMNYII